MKLQKPTVNTEQTLLEEYVDFLLTDHSNVLPLKQQAGKEPRTQNGDSVASSEKKLDLKKTELGNNSLSTFDSDSSRPNWASIENAAVKKRKSVKNKASDSKNVDSDNASEISQISQDKGSSKSTDDDYLLDSDASNCVSVESMSSISHTNPSFVEESESEQLKHWDELLTEEKEKAKESVEGEKIPQQVDSIVSIDSSEEIDSPEEISSGHTQRTERGVVPKPKIKTELSKREKSTKREKSGEVLAPQVKDQKNLPSPNAALIDELPDKDPRLDNVEKLLAKISLATLPKVPNEPGLLTDTDISETSEIVSIEKSEASAGEFMQQESTQATFARRSVARARDVLPEVFQTLIFHVGKLPLAVPLLKLGGIVKISKSEITPLVGSPDWFMGLLPNDRGSLMVVDTQRYLMPEQLIKDAEEDYQYLIVLDDSNWALACNSVGDAKNLTHDDVRWSEKNSQRPWFAGMVVDFMSALIEVDELINMLVEHIVEK